MATYSKHFLNGKFKGWDTKAFCNNVTIANAFKVQDCTDDISKVTCKRCLAKIERYKQTEKGRKLLAAILEEHKK